MRQNETNPAVHNVMLVEINITNETDAVREKIASGEIIRKETRADGTKIGLSKSLAHTIESTDAKEVRDFFKGQCLTAGFSVCYAINQATGEVVELFKKGKIAMCDVKPLIEAGFSEWTYSWCWAPEHFFSPERGVVQVTRRIDLSPVATTRTAIQYAPILGRS